MVQTKTRQCVPHVPTSSCAQMVDAKTWRLFVTERTIVKITAMKIRYVSVSHKVTWDLKMSTGFPKTIRDRPPGDHPKSSLNSCE